MRRRLVLPAVVVALVATLALACSNGDGDGTNGGETPDGSTTPGSTATTPVLDGTAVPTFPVDPGEPTPRDLDGARERLSTQLDAIGANIGAVPDDIRGQLLDRCEVLKQFADDGDVEAICQTIEQAIETNDPGLIDRVLSQLADLEGD
jgi:hypothetical protein